MDTAFDVGWDSGLSSFPSSTYVQDIQATRGTRNACTVGAFAGDKGSFICTKWLKLSCYPLLLLLLLRKLAQQIANHVLLMRSAQSTIKIEFIASSSSVDSPAPLRRVNQPPAQPGSAIQHLHSVIMSGFTLFSLVLVALCCYSATGRQQQQQLQQKLLRPQIPKQLDLAHRQITPEPKSLPHQRQDSQAADLNSEHRQKRSQRDLANEYKDWSELLEELEENALLQGAALPAELDLENMSPLTYFLLLQKLKQLQSSEPVYRVRTPRLGRSIDFQLEDDGADDDFDARQQQFLTRLMKKSVPFKPRLGKRGQACD